jgi:hypothetical protein
MVGTVENRAERAGLGDGERPRLRMLDWPPGGDAETYAGVGVVCATGEGGGINFEDDCVTAGLADAPDGCFATGCAADLTAWIETGVMLRDADGRTGAAKGEGDCQDVCPSADGGAAAELGEGTMVRVLGSYVPGASGSGWRSAGEGGDDDDGEGLSL